VARKKWADLSGRQKTLVLIGAAVQLALAATAWTDLARRPADRVNGRKGPWAAIIGLNTWIGPLAWFRWGRRR
jgi:hypothetical protein